MKFEVNTPEELKHLQDRAMMLKMICLDVLGEKPLADVSRLNKRMKIKLQVEIEKRWEDTDILQQFNELCIQTIFDNIDAESLPTINVGRKEDSVELVK